MSNDASNVELVEFERAVRNTVALKLRSKAVVLQRLSGEIDRLADLGYTHARMIEVMKDAGLEFTLGTFRSTLSRIKTAAKSKSV